MGQVGHYYAGQSAVLATKHGKERAVGPVMHRDTGLVIEVPEALDTDRLGTFSGEIERQGGMRETAIRKARMGMAASGLGIGLASEGSYGPHPFIPFVAGGVELIVFLDDQAGILFHEEMVVDQTNFGHLVTNSVEEACSFAGEAGFPHHGLMVRPNRGGDSRGYLAKGIQEWSLFRQSIHESMDLSEDGRARIETDMRAHVNPTRMKAIGTLAEKLSLRLARCCPACDAPGFGLIDVVSGLPCRACGSLTELPRVELHGCSACGHSTSSARRDGLTVADPARCPRCNP